MTHQKYINLRDQRLIKFPKLTKAEGYIISNLDQLKTIC